MNMRVEKPWLNVQTLGPVPAIIPGDGFLRNQRAKRLEELGSRFSQMDCRLGDVTDALDEILAQRQVAQPALLFQQQRGKALPR
jgi:hypothetical protein